MPTLYIANCSQQVQIINYRLVESPKVWTQPIPIGRQIQIGSGEMDQDQIDAVIYQLSRYGLVSVDDIKRAKANIPYIYSLNRPVPASKIMDAINFNRAVLTDRGRTMRLEAAIAANTAIDGYTQENDLAPVKALEMSVEEERHGSLESDTKPVGEGFRMDRQASAANAPRRGRPRKAA